MAAAGGWRRRGSVGAGHAGGASRVAELGARHAAADDDAELQAAQGLLRPRGRPEDTLERMRLLGILIFHILSRNFIEIRLSTIK